MNTQTFKSFDCHTEDGLRAETFASPHEIDKNCKFFCFWRVNQYFDKNVDYYHVTTTLTPFLLIKKIELFQIIH